MLPNFLVEQAKQENFEQFVADVAHRHKLSQAQQEVLSLVLQGDQINEVGATLDLQPDTVRKRLSEIYRKLKVKGRGPGKLEALRKQLLPQLEKRTRQKKIFVVWSEEYGKTLAEKLVFTILQHPRLSPTISPIDLASESLLSLKSQIAAEEYDFCVGCLTPNQAASLSVILNAGFLRGQIGSFSIIRLGRLLGGPLARFPVFAATQEDELKKLLSILLSNDDSQEAQEQAEEEATKQIEEKFWRWQEILERVPEKQEPLADRDIENAVRKIQDEVRRLEENPYYEHNSCLRKIIHHCLDSIGTFLSNTLIKSENSDQKTGFPTPAVLYNNYLLSLQLRERESFLVKAISIFEESEQFWHEESGNEILKYSNRRSVRVFLYTTQQRLQRNYDILLKHAQRYNVYAAHYGELSSWLRDFNSENKEKYKKVGSESFAIFEFQGEKVIVTPAKFLTDQHFSLIHFDPSPQRVQSYENWMRTLTTKAQKIESEADINRLLDKAPAYPSET